MEDLFPIQTLVQNERMEKLQISLKMLELYCEEMDLSIHLKNEKMETSMMEMGEVLFAL